MKMFDSLSSKCDCFSTLNAELRKMIDIRHHHLVEEPDDLSSDMFSPRLLVIHNASTCCQNHVAKLSAG
jgi:hypothetical protein